MKTEKEIKSEIKRLEKEFKHILTGRLSTIIENAPRALMQLSVESSLKQLHWVLGSKFKSRLKGVDR